MSDFALQLQATHERVNGVLDRFFASLDQSEPLIQAMRHGALIGGKRLRPFLVYHTGQLFGLSLENLDTPAAAVECMHAYSLIHDDLPAMDDDDLRRGQPTCHIKFGETIAILAGDALQTLAFSILTDGPMPAVTPQDRLLMISALAQASGAEGMCLGQALDLQGEGLRVTLPALENIHRHKTGALIRASVKLGALAAGEPGKQALPYLDRYAAAIGLAFQVQDDILDVVGDTATLGKRQGADLQLGKNTYPALLGLDGARAKAQALHRDALASLEYVEALGYDTSTLAALAHFVIERNK